MTAHALISGVLFRRPETRTSKAGKPFVTATLKAKDGDAAQWWKIIAFSEGAQAELARLSDGDALSVQGALKVETYERDSETKLSLSIVADQVLALRQPPRKRESRPEGDRRSDQVANFADNLPRNAKDKLSAAEVDKLATRVGVADPGFNGDLPF